MKKYYSTFLALAICLTAGVSLFAGNPDRQGEAGAYELLMVPWARTAGLSAMNASFVGGVEAMRVNPAGIGRIDATEVVLGHSIYLDGTGLKMNALGVAQKTGKGAFGVSLMAVDFGDIPVTTTDQPEGTGSTFSPTFFNIGFGYSHVFENKISVGILLRGVSESIADLTAFGFAIDAGVQYVTGPQDNFKFGISLRNVGSRMTFGGQGLAAQRPASTSSGYNLTYDVRATSFELPSLLNIGASYDFYLADMHRLTMVGNFTSNSFSQDQIGGGFEYAMKERFMLRAGYRHEFKADNGIGDPVYSGLSFGASIEVPTGKKDNGIRLNNSALGIDYAYRDTQVWNGTHNISVRLKF